MMVTSDFSSKEGRKFKGLIHIAELNLCKYKAFIITVKFVNLYDMLPIRHKVAGLLNATCTAESKELARILQRDFLLPLKTTDTIFRRTFDCQVALVATSTHTHRMAMPTTDIALQNL